MRWPVRRGLLSSIWAPATTENWGHKAMKRNKPSAVRFYLASSSYVPLATISWLLLSQTPGWSAKQTFKAHFCADLQLSSMGSVGLNVWDQTNTLPTWGIVFHWLEEPMQEWEPTDWVPFTRSDPDRKYCHYNYKKTQKHICTEWIFQTCCIDLEYLSPLTPWVNSTVNLMLAIINPRGKEHWADVNSHPLQIVF